MKRIIEIDGQHFELLQMAVMNGMGDNAKKIIAQSIPLDKIKDEIDGIEINGQVDEHTMFIRTGEQVKQIALEIIDKHIKESSDADSD